VIRCVVNQHPMMDRDYAGPETPAQRLDIAFTAAREEACRRAKSKLAAVEAQRDSYAHSTDSGTADALDADDTAALSSGSDGCDSDPDEGMRACSESDEDAPMQQAIQASLEPSARAPRTSTTFGQLGSQLSSTRGASAYLPWTTGMVSSHTQGDVVRAEDALMQQAIHNSLESAAPSAPAARKPTTFAQSRIFGASAPPPVPPKVRNTKPKQSPAVPFSKASFFAPRG
jgi:hypothetical protein